MSSAESRGPSVSFYGTTIGKKIVMAVTGIVLVAFLVAHLLGNLLVFAGPGALDRYSALLRSNPALVWLVRIGLLVATAAHVHAAWTLSRLAAAARPDRYARLDSRASTLSSRTMRAGGVLLLLFVGFHLLHLTTGSAHPDFRAGEVYRNVAQGFRSAPVVVFYLAAMLALGLHLKHGVGSLFQTLGAEPPRIDRLRRGLGLGLAVGLGIGFAIIPLAVLAGLVR